MNDPQTTIGNIPWSELHDDFRALTGTSASSGEWWKDHFDDAYTLVWDPLLDGSRTVQEALVIVRVLAERGIEAPARLLDVPCATGRMAIALADEGFDAVGIDQSAHMINVGRQRARSMDGPGSASFQIGDARTLRFDESFDAAIEWGTSIGYGTMDDDVRILSSIRASLVPGGVMLLETDHLDHVIRIDEKQFALDTGGGLVYGVSDLDPRTGRYRELRVMSPHGSTEVRRQLVDIHFYRIEEIIQLCHHAGFEAVECRDETGRGEPGSATRLLVVACAP